MVSKNGSGSFTNDKIAFQGLTFDDVLVVPAYSQVLPREVNTTTQLTENISINVPIISAAMDTVTEAKLAIAIARQGGIGMLHKNMTIEKQAEEVRKVKRSDSGLILDPITLTQDAPVTEALRLMHENKIGGIPIIDDQKKLVGILTNRDLRFEKNIEQPVKDAMTAENLVTAPKGTSLKQAESILQKHRIEKLPIVDEAGVLVGLITYKDILKESDYPNACKDQFGRLRVGAAVGVTANMLERMQALVDVEVDTITIDTAHGHSKGVLDAIKLAKKEFPELELIAGNVATGSGAKALVDVGINAVKVGVGPGSICTTRIIAGIGIPQLSAIYEAKKAIANSGIPVIADGGIRYTGDIVKAIVAGADSIMAGSLFAGVEESPGETIIYEGRKFKSYRGMGSVEAMKKGSKDRYFQDAEDDLKNFKGKLQEVMMQYLGGLRAGMGYCGAQDIKTLQKAQFTIISGAGMRESHPHDIVITKEAPNYSR